MIDHTDEYELLNKNKKIPVKHYTMIALLFPLSPFAHTRTSKLHLTSTLIGMGCRTQGADVRCMAKRDCERGLVLLNWRQMFNHLQINYNFTSSLESSRYMRLFLNLHTHISVLILLLILTFLTYILIILFNYN